MHSPNEARDARSSYCRSKALAKLEEKVDIFEKKQEENIKTKPSDFTALGTPYCSKWCNIDSEKLAIAYMEALELLGDEWKELTLDECLAALGGGERAHAFYRVKRAQMIVQKFEEIRATCSTLEGAVTVGGWWRLTE